jgi:rare lipoprotein A
MKYALIFFLLPFIPVKQPKPENKYPLTQTGVASYYGTKKFHNSRTASGERMHRDSLTAAHRTFPFGTRVKVTNLQNQKSVVVRINDRGPASKKRIIDVSVAAARKLDMIQSGLARVRVEVVPKETMSPAQ